ncbi:MAG: carboxypeptidase-like regulatory domain-containing protein, partial [Odoribacter splanchnicus]
IIISPSSFKTKSPQEEEKNWVRGVVYSESDGSPLPGVVIRSKTTPAAVTTDVDGRFEIEEAVGGILVFSFLGMETLEVQIDDESELVIRLKEELTVDEVIVTGYQTISRKELLVRLLLSIKDIQQNCKPAL